MENTKPLPQRMLEMELLDLAIKLNKLFGDNISIELKVKGLDNTAIYAIADYVKDTGKPSEDIVIHCGKDTLKIETNELPF